MLFSIGLHNAAVAIFLALLVWGVTRVWKNSPAAHLLWLLVLVKLVTPPVLNLELWKWDSGSVSVINDQAAGPSPSSPQPIANDAHVRIPRSPRIIPSNTDSNPKPNENPKSVARNDQRLAIAAPSSIKIAAVWRAVRPVLMWTWVGGAGLIALLATIRIVRFHRLLAGTLPGSQRLRSTAEELAVRMGLWRCPDVRVVESAAAPFVWCLGWRATVVLPRRLLDALDEQQIAMVLAHELAHLRRGDHWVRILELVVSVLYWWNPLVWWVRRRLHAVEEQCCDAWVAWVYPDHGHDYAESLLKAAQLVPAQAPLPMLASPFLNTHTLKERIEMVLKNRSQRSASRGAVLGLFLLAAVVLPMGVRGLLRGEEPAEATLPKEVSKPPVKPLPSKVAEKPIAKQLQPFQGTWDFETYESLKWPAQPEESRTWQWKIQGDEITWTRPGKEAVKLSFAVDPGFVRDPKKWPNNIEFTLLNGPDKGQKCLGSFYWFADTQTVWFCFQDPGEKGERPTKMSFNGFDRLTVLSLHPAQQGTAPKTPVKVGADVPPLGGKKLLPPEMQVFEGTWNFGACESELWYTELDVIRKTWSWKVVGREITWTRGKEVVKLSFTVDPTKQPNQIDFTYLDGPDKGEKCQGIYEFERGHIWLCMTEPGAKVDRPTRMGMKSGSKHALIILQDKNQPRTAEATKPAAAKPEPTPAAPPKATAAPKPAMTNFSPFQGSWNFESWNSEKWDTKSKDFQACQWTIKGQEMTWSRSGKEAVKFSFTLDPSAFPRQIDLTFLDGPDKGQKCQGIYFASRHEIVVCFQEPGTKAERPTRTDSKPGSHNTTITLVPADILPTADEVRALQGTWKFDIYYSDWWPEKISNPPISWSKWRWTVKGNEITWTGMKVPDVKLSFTVDPSKSPRQIDLTFLDGPHKGQKLRGMYKFFYAEDGCYICFADPEANVDRPADVSYSTNEGRTMVSIERVPPEKLPTAATPPADANSDKP